MVDGIIEKFTSVVPPRVLLNVQIDSSSCADQWETGILHEPHRYWF